MRNKIYSYIIISALAFSACTKLDLNPKDQISSATFWNSKSEFDDALTAVYGSLQASGFSHELPLRDCLTDNGYAQFNSGSDNSISSGSLTPTVGGYVDEIYADAFKGITRVNSFLQQLAQYKGTDMSDNDKKTYEAESKFIRGFFYFQLYSVYGDVPLVVEPLTLETQRQPKTTADKVLAQILSDLDFAIANLPDVSYTAKSGNEHVEGHAVSTSAQAFKARVLLFAAYGNTGTPDPAIIKQVRDITLGIMNNANAKYSLSPKFEDIFRTATQESNPEIIFSVKYLAPNNYNPMDMYYGDWVAADPLQNLVNDYECTDGLPYGVSPLTNTGAPFENRDPRLAKTIFVDHPDFGNGVIWTPSNPRPTGYGVLKVLDPANLPFGFSTRSAQDVIILRYADVLLMYAEAENELSGPIQSVYDAMTSLRGRVGMPAYPGGLSKEQMRDRIRHERRIELAFEGLRHYDLIRWRTAAQVMNNLTDGPITHHFEDRFYKWPLPQSEIDKNEGVLVQNPDYN